MGSEKGPEPTGYRPLGDYGLIGDCYSAALVSVEGSIDWLCVPRFDSPSLFARILDFERGGHFLVQPARPFHAHHRYVPNTAVLQTVFSNGSGEVRVTDFMPIEPGDKPWRWGRPRARRAVVRLVECVRGELDMIVKLDPRPDYGRGKALIAARPGGASISAANGTRIALFATTPLDVGQHEIAARRHLRAGDSFALVLDLEGRQSHARDLEDEVRAELERTTAFWKSWCARCKYRGVYDEAVMRSAITLKLLTYAPSGGMVAAPTTSLPEEIGGVRNWDYRYTWIRDASLGAYALLNAGHEEDAFCFFEWVAHVALRSEPGAVQIMYGIDGERDLPETTLGHLEGYRRSRPVRIGNAASRQFQLDVYGELLDCFHAYRRVGKIPAEHRDHVWPAFRQQVDYAAAHWRRPDSGIWEMRSPPQHFVYSKVMAWTALDRGIRAAEALGLEADVELWRREREAIRRDVIDNGYDRAAGAFMQAYGAQRLDAANLLLPIVEFVNAADEQMRSTVEATERHLLADGLVYRYRAVDDGVTGSEATFAVCTFWLIENYVLLGRVSEARALFENMLARATPLGLYGEELEPSEGGHLGNFPQGLTHIGLINAAVRLKKALES